MNSITFQLLKRHYTSLTTRKFADSDESSGLKYPDCIAIRYDKFNSILTTFYNDHSFYVWDLVDLNRIGKLDGHLYHSATCWSLDIFTSSCANYENMRDFRASRLIPLDSLISCSSDNTIRIWAPVFGRKEIIGAKQVVGSAADSKLKRNGYSKELLKIIYVDEDYSALCEPEQVLDSSDYTSKVSFLLCGFN